MWPQKKYWILVSSVFLQMFLFNAVYGQVGSNPKDSIRKQKSPVRFIDRKTIDSLKQLLSKAPQDTSMVSMLILLSDLESNDVENATTELAQKAYVLAEKLKFKRGLALSCRSIANIYQNKRDYKTAITYYKQAIDIGEASIPMRELYPPLLNLYFYLGNYTDAMRTVTHELEVYEKIKNKAGIADCNNLLGYIHFNQGNFEESEKYYARYINNTRELDDSTMLAHALGELADVFTGHKEYDRSIDTLNKVLKICERGMALKGKDHYGLSSWLPQYRTKAMFRMGRNYKLKGNLPEALKFSLNSLDIQLGNGVTDYDSASYYINVGDIYKEMEEYGKALHYLNFGFEIATRIQHNENTRDAAEYLAETYAHLNRYDSAYYFYRLFTTFKDSIVNNETKTKITEIQAQFDVAKKDKEIIRQHQFRNILIGTFALLLMALGFLYNRYQLKQKNRYQKELNRQQNELFNAIAGAQDQERKRIAQDIHDSLGAILSAAKLRLSALKDAENSLPDDLKEKYQTSLQLLDEASSELRNISHNIMPATLSKLGLVAALKNLTNSISSYSGLQISFSAHDFTERLEEQKEISIYRIILELINNVVKHAAATRAIVQLVKHPDSINISVEDNGKGFDYQKALQDKKGIGLGNVLSRVDYMKGTIDIDAVPGRGTMILIDIPWKTGETEIPK